MIFMFAFLSTSFHTFTLIYRLLFVTVHVSAGNLLILYLIFQGSSKWKKHQKAILMIVLHFLSFFQSTSNCLIDNFDVHTVAIQPPSCLESVLRIDVSMLGNIRIVHVVKSNQLSSRQSFYFNGLTVFSSSRFKWHKITCSYIVSMSVCLRFFDFPAPPQPYHTAFLVRHFPDRYSDSRNM